MNKQQILALQGVPASGKSTWARQYSKDNPGWVVVNRDTIRKGFSDEWSPKLEKTVIDMEDSMIRNAAESGYSVIVDDTNLNPLTIKHLEDLAGELNLEISFKFFDVSFGEAIERDSNRENSVGSRVIRNMFRKYFPEKLTDFRKMKIKCPNKKDCIICDIDGTIALARNRDWFEYDKVITDTEEWRVIHLVRELSKTNRIIFITGREEICRNVTECWMRKYGFKNYDLYMRPEGDNRKDEIIKKEIFETQVDPHYNVTAVFDDRDAVVKMWRDLGLLCCQVYYGDF